MSQNRQYILPATAALILHVTLFASLIFGLSLPRAAPVTPLAIQATLVVDPENAPPPVIEREEPPPEQPPPDEPSREQLEAQKLEQDRQREEARIEQQEREAAEAEAERLQALEIAKREAAEAKRLAEEEAARKRAAEEAARLAAEEEARRKAEDEARKERERIEAEKQRQAEIQRQREENERKRREAEAALLADQIEAEDRRLSAIQAGARQAYVFAIQQKIYRNWVAPATAREGLDCTVKVRQAPGGIVSSVTVTSCNGDAAVVRSIVAAVEKASPLPEPSEASLFERDLNIIFKPEQ